MGLLCHSRTVRVQIRVEEVELRGLDHGHATGVGSARQGGVAQLLVTVYGQEKEATDCGTDQNEGQSEEGIEIVTHRLLKMNREEMLPRRWRRSQAVGPIS